MIEVETAYMDRTRAYDYAKERIKLLLNELEYALDNNHPIAAERAANELPFLTYCAVCFAPERPFNEEANHG